MTDDERAKRVAEIRQRFAVAEARFGLADLGEGGEWVRILLAELDRVTAERDRKSGCILDLESGIEAFAEQRDAALAQVKVMRDWLRTQAEYCAGFATRYGIEDLRTMLRCASEAATNLLAATEPDPKPKPTTVCPECGARPGHDWCGRVGGPVTPEPVSATEPKP